MVVVRGAGADRPEKTVSKSEDVRKYVQVLHHKITLGSRMRQMLQFVRHPFRQLLLHFLIILFGSSDVGLQLQPRQNTPSGSANRPQLTAFSPNVIECQS